MTSLIPEWTTISSTSSAIFSASAASRFVSRTSARADAVPVPAGDRLAGRLDEQGEVGRLVLAGVSLPLMPSRWCARWRACFSR